MKFKILDDLAMADTGFEAYGGSLEELLENCGKALFETMVDVGKIGLGREFRFEVKGEGKEEAVFDYLSELIFLKDKEGVVLGEFAVEVEKEGKKREIKVKAWGEKVNFEKHKFKVDVKAVTMHKLKVEKKEKKWVARVVLDI